MTMVTEEQKQNNHKSVLMSCPQQLCKEDNTVNKLTVPPLLVPFIVTFITTTAEHPPSTRRT